MQYLISGAGQESLQNTSDMITNWVPMWYRMSLHGKIRQTTGRISRVLCRVYVVSKTIYYFVLLIDYL